MTKTIENKAYAAPPPPGKPRLLDEVRRESSPDVRWAAIDTKVMFAARESAADIRRGALRPSHRPMVMTYACVALAAAAALVFVVRQRAASHDVSGDRVAIHAPSTTSGGEHGAPATPVFVAQPVQARVLLLATPVTYASRGESARPMTALTVAREGGRIATGEHAGRAVMGLHAGYRVDARAGTEIELASLSTEDMTLVLTKGEARLDGPALAHGRVAIRSGEWTVLAKGGGFLARIDGGSVRVTVLSGKVHVTRAGGEEREVLAGNEVELTAATSEPRLVGHATEDTSALDERLFAESDTGEAMDVPVGASGATLAIDGIALPAGLTALRVREPRVLVARAANDEWSLALDPQHADAALAWRRERLVGTQAARVAGTTPAQAVVAGGPPDAAQTAVAIAQASPVETPPVVAPEAPEAATGSAPYARRQLEQELSTRAASCYAECLATHSCGEGVEAHVHFDPESDGRATNIRVVDVSSFTVSQCIAEQTRGLRVPSFMRGETVHLTVHPVQR
ncbi:MAG: FecR domain-containing protein [Deltaproteobacteria bacterium]